MRTVKTETVNGQVGTDGVSQYGPLITRRTGLGAYTLTAPPGRTFIGITLTPANDWRFVIAAAPSGGRSYSVQFANSTAGSLADTNFHYTALLAA